MRLVIQRTAQARVVVDGRIIAEIGAGMLILAGIACSDSRTDAEYLAKRVPELRIFADDIGKMNLDLRQVAGSVLIIPNFTLCADWSRGRRPAFDAAARPEVAKPLFEYLIELFMNKGIPTKTGLFGADMRVELVNDGPVSFVLDSTSR